MSEPFEVAVARRWLEQVVISMDLCPFAGRELIKNRVRFAVSKAVSEDQLLLDLQEELKELQGNDAIETTLLIHSDVLQDFADYNQFLDYVDALLEQMNLIGVFQIASFHPGYQFEGTSPDDPENYTNRSPYPILHILREESLERAIDEYPDVGQIPVRNVALMNSLGHDKLMTLMKTIVN